MKFAVDAVGTDNGRSCLFLKQTDAAANVAPIEMVIPTDTASMAKLAATGQQIRNTNEVKKVRRNT